MSTVLITGISGTLGEALGTAYRARGWSVVGVTRRADVGNGAYDVLCQNAQATREDARELLAFDPDLIILNAGQIETEIGPGGVPLAEVTASITTINYHFPTMVALEAAARRWEKRVDIVAIGSIADGSPSCFGPVYHASKIALHYFVSGVGPIVAHANPNLRLRLYRPGAIKGPLSWAPVNRLNEKGYRIRAKRCESAPDGSVVAKKIQEWIDGDGWIGTYHEPFSFKIFKWFFALAPNAFYKLQLFGWKKGSKFFEAGQRGRGAAGQLSGAAGRRGSGAVDGAT